MTDKDIWHSIPEFPAYSMNAAGQVRREDSGRLLKVQYVAQSAYYQFWDQGQAYNRGIGRLKESVFGEE